MDTFISFGIGLLANVSTFLIGFYSKKVLTRLKYRHIHDFISGAKQVKIVLSGFNIKDFQIGDIKRKSTIPINIALMPLNEGKAIAKIATILKDVFPHIDVIYESHQNFQDNGIPFFCIGGPSINNVTKLLIEKDFKKFTIHYPQHTASFGSINYSPRHEEKNNLIEDYGFLLKGVTDFSSKYIILCGIWATGTEIATEYLFNKSPINKNLTKFLKNNSKLFSVVYGQISNYEIFKITDFGCTIDSNLS